MMTQSTCYKSTSTMQVKGVLWHSTGANNPWIKRYVQPDDKAEDRAKMLTLIGTNVYKNDWNHISHQAGLNAWIGKLANSSVAAVQTMPWNYRPWGCGAGSKGSCNSGWIQFEICEDGLTDSAYFNQVYKEACELTAYLCKMYGIDPNGYVTVNGVKVPTILCHKDSANLGLGCNHGDVLHWFPQFGKNMDSVRKDVTILLNGSGSAGNVSSPAVSGTSAETEMYRVRKTWADSKSQIGAYKVLDNAKKQADRNPGYKVFDSKGAAVYDPSAKVQTKKTVEELAKEVILGKWGNGTDRKNRLTAAGYDYSAVQKRVNELMK